MTRLSIRVKQSGNPSGNTRHPRQPGSKEQASDREAPRTGNGAYSNVTNSRRVAHDRLQDWSMVYGSDAGRSSLGLW